MKKGKHDLSDAPMEKLAFEALKEAVSGVIDEHKRTGEPIVIWRDGKVVKVPADQIEVREAQADYTTKKKSKLKKAPKSVTPAKAGVQTSSRRKSGTRPLNLDSGFHPPGRSPLRDGGRND